VDDPNLIARVDVGNRTIDLVGSLGRIDLDNLAEETQTTGMVALWWGDFAARAKKRASTFELRKDVVWAQLSMEKRQDLLQRAEKSTEDLVRSMITTDLRYQQAYTEWLQAVEDADKIESAKFTIARKQSTLEALAPLLFQEHAARRPPVLDLPQATTIAPVRTPVQPVRRS